MTSASDPLQRADAWLTHLHLALAAGLDDQQRRGEKAQARAVACLERFGQRDELHVEWESAAP